MRIVTTAGLVGLAYLLLSSAWSHAFGRWTFRRALQSHRILPRVLIRPLTVAVPALEASLGVSLIIAVLASYRPGRSSILAATGSAFCLAFFAYGTVLVLRRPGVDCGCMGRATPINVWVPIRALAFGLLALPAATGTPLTRPEVSVEFGIVCLAGSSLGLLGYFISDALDDPRGRLTTVHESRAGGTPTLRGLA